MSEISQDDVDERGVRRMAKGYPSAAAPPFRCEYCGSPVSDAPGLNDCQCDPPGSGFPRHPRDSDYVTRCAVCDSAIRWGLTGGPDLYGWVHVWPSTERSGHRAALAGT